MVGSICDKCTMPVDAASANVCGMCHSWRCRECEWYSRDRNATCELCNARRPPPSVGGAAAAPPPPRVGASPAGAPTPLPQPPTRSPDGRGHEAASPPFVSSHAQPGAVTVCRACTFHNRLDCSLCDMCGSPLGAAGPAFTAPPPPPPVVAAVPVPAPAPVPQQRGPNMSLYPAQHMIYTPPPPPPPQQQQWPQPPAPAHHAAPYLPGPQHHHHPHQPQQQPPSPAPQHTPADRRQAEAAARREASVEMLRRQSTVLVGDHDFTERIEEARRLCRLADTPFVAVMNQGEHVTLEWGSIFRELRPGLPEHVQAASDGRGFFTQLARALQQQAQLATAAGGPRRNWHVFPPHGISADDIAQGELGDCWFLSAVAVLAHARPQLIEKLFLVKDVTPDGVFAVRLWNDGVWTPYLVDGNFPTAFGRMFRYGRCKHNDALWVPLLEKAYAMMHGSYQAIVAGTLDEAFYDLTGLPCEKVRLHDPAGMNVAVDLDETFARIASMHTGECTMGASCGCSSLGDAEAQRRQLRPRHCYSVLEVTTDRVTQRRLIRLRNPWGRSDYAGVAEPRDGHARTAMGGAFWMDFAEFVLCFSDVVVCYTREYRAGFSASPLCDPSTSYFCPLRPGADNAVALHVAEPTTLRFMAVQHKLRGGGDGPRNDGYFDVALFLMRFDANGYASIIASSTGACDRVVNYERMLDPGLYAVLPFSIQQCRARVCNLTVNVLCESDRVAMVDWADVVPRQLPLNRLLYQFLVADAPHVKRDQSGPWRTTSWSNGTLRFELIEHGGSAASECTFDSTHSEFVVTVPAPLRVVQLPPRGGCAIALASTVQAHDGAFQMRFAQRTAMKESGRPGFGGLLAGALGHGHAAPQDNSPLVFHPFSRA